MVEIIVKSVGESMTLRYTLNKEIYLLLICQIYRKYAFSLVLSTYLAGNSYLPQRTLYQPTSKFQYKTIHTRY